ncbi:MAG: hypothetical protein AB1700_03945 [Bacillota bacterium]
MKRGSRYSCLATDMRIAPPNSKDEGRGLNCFTVGAIYKHADVFSSLDEIVEALRRVEGDGRR